MVRPKGPDKRPTSLYLRRDLTEELNVLSDRFGGLSAAVEWFAQNLGGYLLSHQSATANDLEMQLLEQDEQEDQQLAGRIESRRARRAERKRLLKEKRDNELAQRQVQASKYPTPESLAKAYRNYPELQVRRLAQRNGHDPDLVIAIQRGVVPPAPKPGQTTLSATTRVLERATK